MIKPLYDRVLIERVEKTEEKKGSIIIPDTAKEKPQEGIIAAVGDGKLGDNGKRMPMTLKKGDRVLFGKYAGTDVKFGGKEYVIMREDELLAIIA